MVLVVNIFDFFFCFVVSICDLVHNVEAIFSPSLTNYIIWKYFLKYE